MKKMYLLLALILFFTNQVKGYKNVDAREDQKPCFDLSTSSSDFSVSDCVDRQLSHGDLAIDDDDNDGRNYDKCCYFRIMTKGTVYYGCIGLDRDDTMDVIDGINLGENSLDKFFKDAALREEGEGFKIYSIDCKASYIKYFSLVFMLFGLLF